MKKQNVCAIILLGVSALLAIVSFVVLPETVITQLSLNRAEAVTMPKLLAIALPTALGVGFAVAALVQKKNIANKNRFLIVSGVGILVFAIMLLVNAYAR